MSYVTAGYGTLLDFIAFSRYFHTLFHTYIVAYTIHTTPLVHSINQNKFHYCKQYFVMHIFITFMFVLIYDSAYYIV